MTSKFGDLAGQDWVFLDKFDSYWFPLLQWIVLLWKDLLVRTVIWLSVFDVIQYFLKGRLSMSWGDKGLEYTLKSCCIFFHCFLPCCIACSMSSLPCVIYSFQETMEDMFFQSMPRFVFARLRFAVAEAEALPLAMALARGSIVLPTPSPPFPF